MIPLVAVHDQPVLKELFSLITPPVVLKPERVRNRYGLAPELQVRIHLATASREAAGEHSTGSDDDVELWHVSASVLDD